MADDPAAPADTPAATSPDPAAGLPFAPARPLAREDGWTPERQADFIEALADSGSVGHAAACVGMSRESAYRLRRRADAADFAAAWEAAIAAATQRLSDACFERAIHGVEVPILYKGEVVATRIRHSDQLAIFLLRQRDPFVHGALSGPRNYDASLYDPVRLAVTRLPALVARLLGVRRSLPSPRKGHRRV